MDEYFVAEMVRAIGQSERIFSVSSRMIQMYHPDRLDDAGDMYSRAWLGVPARVGRDLTHYRRSSRVFSACAGAAIYRREVFEEIGYFDEMHFAYLEDIDVGYRARIAGYDNIYCPAALVWHVGSGTSGSKYNSFKVKLAARNNVYLNYKKYAVLTAYHKCDSDRSGDFREIFNFSGNSGLEKIIWRSERRHTDGKEV